MLKKNTVFITSLVATLLFIFLGVFFNDFVNQSFSLIVGGIVGYFGWFFILGGFLFLVVGFYLAFSKYGNIRLGDDTDRPEFSTSTWIAMLFSAGIGVGLVFWGIAEPVNHYQNPPFGEGFTAEAADLAMRYSFFHWGLGAWAIYGIVALCIAYFHYRKRLPVLPSSIFYPIIGDRIYGPIGKTIDSYAIFMVALNTAVVFGMISMQLTSGLNSIWDVPNNLTTQMIVIGVLTVIFLISSSTGLKRGIKYLSNTNMLLGFLLLSIIFLLGPSVQLVHILISSTASYIGTLIPASLRLETFAEDPWINSWTVFYWAWMCAWTPFVGSFIARISKGRTIREFVFGVFAAPTGIAIVWFSIFGGTALHLIHNLGFTPLIDAVNADISVAFFAFLGYFPYSSVLNILAVFLIVTFFVTSADSVTFTLGMYSKNGDTNPSNAIKMTWGILFAAAAVVLLMSGGLDAMQNVIIAITFPFYILMVFMCYAIMKDIKKNNKLSNETPHPYLKSNEKTINMYKQAK
ncbi:BCCT family transporter [Anaerobacillus sp. MEB173]|uniref:BCCT family transporter n=1 Tax=Anaerobacillus sp. MEB173 TaxID=3383345 RepID=UPI003F8EF1F3